MKTKQLLKIAGVVLVVCVTLAGIGLAASVLIINSAVKKYSAAAQQDHPHPDDNVAALIDYVNSEGHSLQDRNHAVWALGQLKDPSALQALEALYTGEPCEHDRNLCQYELAKAIKRCGGTPNPTRKKKG